MNGITAKLPARTITAAIAAMTTWATCGGAGSQAQAQAASPAQAQYIALPSTLTLTASEIGSS